MRVFFAMLLFFFAFLFVLSAFVEVVPDDRDIRPDRIVVPPDCRTYIEQIERMQIPRRDARDLSRFYTDLSKAITDDDHILTSSEARSLNRICGEMRFPKRSLSRKYPELRDAVDDTIAASVGSRKNKNGTYEIVALDDDKRNNLADGLRGVAAALYRK